MLNAPYSNRFAVTYTCTDFTFSAKKAEKDFGFRPKYSRREALTKTIGYYQKNRSVKGKTGKKAV